MTLTPQQALLRIIEHREIFHDEMLALFRQIMGGEMSPVMIAALTMGLRVKKESIGNYRNFSDKTDFIVISGFDHTKAWAKEWPMLQKKSCLVLD